MQVKTQTIFTQHNHTTSMQNVPLTVSKLNIKFGNWCVMIQLALQGLILIPRTHSNTV